MRLFLGLLVVLALLVFGLAPLAAVLWRAFDSVAIEELRSTTAQWAWLRTIGLSLTVTAVAVPWGAALAWLLERTDVVADRWQRPLAVLFASPLAVPPYLFAMAWALLGNPRTGLLNRWTGLPLDLYGFDGIVLVLATSAHPFAFLALRAALSRADPSLEEAARICGATPFEVLRQVTLPLLRPALIASGGLVFGFSAAAFGVPYLLGMGAEPPQLYLTTLIFRHTSLGGAELLSRASTLALLLLLTTALAQGLADRLGRGPSVVQVSGKTARPARVKLGKLRPWLRGGLMTHVLLFLILPLSTILWTSLMHSFAEPTRLTTNHWRLVAGRAETWDAFARSLLLAASAGLLVAILGFMLARLAQAQPRWGRPLILLASAPYAVPGTVLGLGLVLAFAVEYRLVILEQITLVLALAGTAALLGIAYAVKYLAFGVRGAQAALAQLHPSLEEAARVAGAGPLRASRDVIVPLMLPALLAAFLLVFLPCLAELTMSVLLFAAGTSTAGTLLFELQSYADPSAAAVVATMVVVLALVGDALARKVERA